VRWLAMGLLVWTIVGFSFGMRSYLYSHLVGPPAAFLQVVPNYMVDFYFWGLASPLIFRLCRRFPIERGYAAERLALHIFVGLAFVAVVTALTLPTLWYLGLVTSQHETLSSYFAALFINPFMVHQGLLAYWGTVVVAHAFEYHRQAKVSQARSSELSTQLAQAQLAALRMQIHPHFLFNTLNSISALLHRDVETADRMIARLSDFLRMTLKSSGTSVVTLDQELEFLKTYLDIENIRFQDNLLVEMDIDESARDANVPNLILQPIVENAVRHGTAKQTGVGELCIRADRKGDRLLISVEDNGPGPSNKASRPGTGMGLANTRARLEQFFGDFRLEIEGRSDRSGTIVSIEVPYLNHAV
jgi:two-component system LytT family sensor kinase